MIAQDYKVIMLILEKNMTEGQDEIKKRPASKNQGKSEPSKGINVKLFAKRNLLRKLFVTNILMKQKSVGSLSLYFNCTVEPPKYPFTVHTKIPLNRKLQYYIPIARQTLGVKLYTFVILF